MRRRLISIAVLITLIIVLVTFLIYVAKNPPRRQVETSLTVGPEAPTGLIKAPTPYLLLPQGKQEYLIQSNPKKGDARGTKVIADPLDAPKGTSQTVSIDLEHDKPITSVKMEIATDNQVKTYDLTLASGTVQKGTWAGNWTMEDTHNEIYSAKFVIVDQDGHQTLINFPIR